MVFMLFFIKTIGSYPSSNTMAVER